MFLLYIPSMHSLMLVQDIYLVQTKAGQKNIPRNWTRSGGTKVRILRRVLFLYQGLSRDPFK